MITRHSTTALALLFTLGLAGAGAVASSADADAAEELGSGAMFSTIDANGDGIIQPDELRAHSQAWFLAIDENSDGQITRDELRSSAVASNRFLREYDLDQNLEITRHEFDQGLLHDYQSATSGAPEGQLTTRDYTESVFNRDQSLVPAAGPAAGGEEDVVSEDRVAADLERAFWRFDRNGDQILAAEEWIGHGDGAPAFADLDADADHQVTRREFLAYGDRQYDSWVGESGRKQLKSRDYAESTRWRDEALVPPADQDHDRQISAEEAAADRTRLFSLYDRNADGIISEEEWNPVWAVVAVEQDAALTREEFIAAREKELEGADLDRDGKVSVWEYRASRTY